VFAQAAGSRPRVPGGKARRRAEAELAASHERVGERRAELELAKAAAAAKAAANNEEAARGGKGK
jgi:hypothetical protein